MIYRTFTNKILDITNLKVDDIDIRDIAWSLSNQMRYAGHTVEQYSVADHSIYMAKYFVKQGQHRAALHALLHDATEAYISDIPSPVKKLIPEIREFENKIYKVIADKFDLDAHLPKEVELMDKAMIKLEIRQFFDRKSLIIDTYGQDGYWKFLDLFEDIVGKL